MDRIRINILKNIAHVNSRKIVNYKHSIDDGVLRITGDEVLQDYAWHKIFDADELSKIKPEYIKKTWITKRPFVECWYELIETEPFDFATTCFSVEMV